MAVLMGPVLHFHERAGDTWRLSALIVTDGAAPDFSSRPGKKSAWEALWTVKGRTAHRCLFDVDLKDTAQTVAYKIGGTAYQVHVPAKDQPPHMAYGSCNGFSSKKEMKKVDDNNYLWKVMAGQHGHQPFHLLLLGGDQVYADEMWERLPVMEKWSDLSYADGDNAPATQEMKDALVEFYFGLYTSRWAQPEVAQMLASVPSIAMWDDHDIIDGWGSYPEKRQQSPVYQQAIWPPALKAFRTFQHQLADGENPRGAIAPGLALSVGHDLGDIAILALDMRSERSLSTILTRAHWDAVFHWMDDLGRRPRHLIVMSSIPVIYPGFDTLETLFAFMPFRQDLEDDLRDHWTYRPHKEERLRLINRLLTLADSQEVRPTLVSGDVHVGAIGYVERLSTLHGDRVSFNQLISSGIVHPGPNGIVLFALGQLFKSRDNITSEIAARMVEFPGTQDRLIGERNFLTLRPDDRGRVWVQWWPEGDGRIPYSNHPYSEVIHPVRQRGGKPGG